MQDSYTNKSLFEISSELFKSSKKVVISGQGLQINDVVAVARSGKKVSLTDDQEVISRITTCYEHMMSDVKQGVPVYGCNTGYGGQAGRVLTNGSSEARVNIAKKISEGIVHVDVSVGPKFSADVVRGAMLIRINMLMNGVSGVKLADLKLYGDALNKHLTPVVNQYGGIGASGDLAHNARVLSVLRQLPGAMVMDKSGKERLAKEALSKAGIKSLRLDPKVGLGLVNGDNFSTALAALLAVDTLSALLLSIVTGAMMVEVLEGSDRSFHPLLSDVRPHAGQKEVAGLYRYLLNGSGLAYQEMKEHKKRPRGRKVQDGYSLRGAAQYQGVNVEKIKQILDVITVNANSVSDNPLWVAPEYAVEGEDPWHWVSGGNFLAMHMVDAMDSLRKIMTQITKLNDRHLARLIDPSENNGLPPNLSDKKAITGCAFKGVQIQSGMFDIYSTLLSFPVSTMFGVHEERNQDITAHSLTSGILGLENLKIARYSLAQNLIAVAQAVDLRGGPKLLSPRTRPVYNFIRENVKYLDIERSLGGEIEQVFGFISNGELNSVVIDNVFSELS